MSPRRDRPISRMEAAAGALSVVLVVAGIVGLSYALLIPADQEVQLPAPAEPVDSGLGVRPCDEEDLPAPDGDSPPAVTSAELIECPDLFDGTRVSFEGEAVGAVMRQGPVAWLHVNDDVYGRTLGPLPEHRLAGGGNAGMAVLVPVAAAQDIATGGFNRRGTGVAITGTYYKNHPADAGAPAIEADNIEVIREARDVDHPVSVPRLAVAGLFAAVTLGLALLWRRSR